MTSTATRRTPVVRETAQATQQEREQERAQRIAQRRKIMEPLKTKLAERRSGQKWMVEQLRMRARITVSEQTVSNYLNGRSALLRDTLTWICAIAEVPLKDVLRSKLAEAIVLQANPHPTRYRPRQQTSNKTTATPS